MANIIETAKGAGCFATLLTAVEVAGLTVVTGAYALGHVSGGHFNPAVTLGLVAAKRFSPKDAGAYIVAQIVGGIIAIAAIWSKLFPTLRDRDRLV